jgi:hypothetical protein
MKILVYLMTGGFLKGYRTQVIGGMAILTAVANYLVGDMSLTDLVQQLPLLLGGAGFAAFGAKVNTVAKNLGVGVK